MTELATHSPLSFQDPFLPKSEKPTFLPQSTHREVEGFGADLRDKLPRTVTRLLVFFTVTTVCLCVPRGRSGPGIEKCQCFLLVFLRLSREELEIEVKGAAGENDNRGLLNRRRG